VASRLTVTFRAIFGEGPLLAPSGHTAEHRFQLSADFVAKVFLRHGTQILGAIGATIE
jgi:hypothetical protein